jgi:hypothetical protein
MAVTTSNSPDYSKVVFSNSGAALDLTDTTLTEDTLGIVSFNVLAGLGAKTTLWSVDDGDVDVAAPAGTTLSNNFVDYNTDLLYKDTAGVKETTAVGGKFWIEGNQAKYDASGIDPALVNAVAVGSSFTDTFEYTIRMANGTLSVGTLSVKIMNTNDGPVAMADIGSVGENETKSFAVLTNDTDADALDTKELVSTGVVTVTSANGVVNNIDASSAFSIVNNEIVFTPGTLFDALDFDDTATVTVSYTMQDNHFAQSSSTLTLTVSGANDQPVIVSNGGADLAVAVSENTTAVTTVQAIDVDAGDVLTYSIFGGADAGDFVVNATTGALSFASAPDFEAPADSNGDNIYVVQVQVSDGHGGTDLQTITVNVADLDEAPPPPTVVHHEGSTTFGFNFDAAQNGEGDDEAHTTVQLDGLSGGFNFSGTIDLTVTGDIDAGNEHVFIKFENGVQVNISNAGGGGGGEPDTVTTTADATFNSANSTLDVVFHTSDHVDGIVQITGVAEYTYDTLAP